MIRLLLALALSAAPWWGAYPGTRLVPVGGPATVLGQLQRVAYFTTGDAPEAVAGHYIRLWRGRGPLPYNPALR